ncbi:hypothetical protein [Faecalibacterium prausnitzii]|uniref:hypothetical protein n=1 Tax=Faecalibacterium prausnitzii TaxID=853 RepID=UPI001CBD823F|nr:hypothetical protein [Faecalibacterium prausnitzii]
MAPFCLLVFFIGSDRAFNFPEDLAGHFADRSSQHIGGSLRIKIKDIQKILVFKIAICIAHRPGKDGICDADSGSSLKGSSDVEFIIPFQIGICNDVADLSAFFLPVLPCKAFRRFNDVIFQRPGTGRNIKRRIQCSNDWLLMLRIHFPELYRTGILPFSGICHIKYIPQFRLLTAHVQKSNALGAALHIAIHPVIPEIVLCTGCCFRSLLIDHQLLRKGILIKPCGCGQKRCPLLFAASDLRRCFLRHLHIISRFRHHLYSSSSPLFVRI